MKRWASAAWRRFAALGRIGWIAAAVYGGAMALMTAWSVLSWEDGPATKPVDEFICLVCLLFAIGCAATAARSTAGRTPTRRRTPWTARAWP